MRLAGRSPSATGIMRMPWTDRSIVQCALATAHSITGQFVPGRNLHCNEAPDAGLPLGIAENMLGSQYRQVTQRSAVRSVRQRISKTRSSDIAGRDQFVSRRLME